MTGSVNITGSFCVNGVCFPFPTGSGAGTGSAVDFNFAFGADPSATTFVTIPNPTGSNRAFALEYNLTSGSLGINSGQLQINTDGNSVAFVDVIVQSNLTGAPTASFTATYNASVPPTLDVKATFLGSNYIISGSYVPLSGLYAGTTGPTGPAGPSGSFNTSSLATTGSNTFIGTETITGSLLITGSATLNDVPLQFIGPLNSAYRPVNYTFVPVTSSINTLHISQSGTYNIDTTSYPLGISSSINIYYYLDLLPTSSDTQLVFSQPSGSFPNNTRALSVVTLVTCSNSTYYWYDTNTEIGQSSGSFGRFARNTRVYTIPSNATSVVKSQTGELTLLSAPNSPKSFHYQYSGSSGIPIT